MGQWLDQPFIDLVSQILDMLPYFMKQARYLAGLVLLFNVSFMIIKYAITKQGLKEDIVKTATAMVLFTILINLYPTIMKGINSIVYQFAVNSTYTNALAKTIDATRYDSEFWQKKGNEINEQIKLSEMFKDLELISVLQNEKLKITNEILKLSRLQELKKE